MTARTKARTIGAAVAISAMAALSACSPFAGGGGSDGVELSLLTFDAGENNSLVEELIDEFEAVHEGVTVTPTYVPEDTYVTKLQTAMLADPPDIATTYNMDGLVQFAPIQESVLDAAGVELDDFNQALRGGCELQGEVYCVGVTVGSMVMIYNKAIFDANGVDYPSVDTPLTFQEWSAIAEQLTTPADNNDEYVWGAGSDTLFAYLDPAEVLDDTGRVVDVVNPQFLGVAGTLTSMVLEGVIPSEAQAVAIAGSGDAAGMKTIFLDGQLATWVTDNYSVADAEAAGLDIGVAPTPVGEGSDPWITTWTTSFGTPAKSENPDEAAQFLQFVATEGQRIYAQYSYVPLDNAVAQEWATDPIRQELVTVAGLARPSVFNPNQWAWNAPLIDALAAGFRGEPLEAALEDAQPKAQQALDTTWEQFDRALAAAGVE